jgi:hypothetical protein
MKQLIEQARQIEQLNDDLSRANSTLSEIVESCEDWLNSVIQEPSLEMIKGIQQYIIKRHPSTQQAIQEPEY